MKFKLIIALVADELTETVVDTARKMGATGETIIKSAQGEGLAPAKTFLGLTLAGQVDVVLFIVETHLARAILEGIAVAGQFSEEVGTGVAFQLDVEDVVGLDTQFSTIKHEIEDQL